MSKSVFIIDTPACCGECPMSGTGVCRKWSMKEVRTFPKECPLVKTPDKKFSIKDGNKFPADYIWGWNECIDAIFEKYRKRRD